jgi:hypothetical protein
MNNFQGKGEYVLDAASYGAECGFDKANGPTLGLKIVNAS